MQIISLFIGLLTIANSQYVLDWILKNYYSQKKFKLLLLLLDTRTVLKVFFHHCSEK